jgi:hypothetical protein
VYNQLVDPRQVFSVLSSDRLKQDDLLLEKGYVAMREVWPFEHLGILQKRSSAERDPLVSFV